MECPVLLPTIYMPPQVRRQLNTIIEEEQDGDGRNGRGPDIASGPPTSKSLSSFKSPMTDDFPTPRAQDFPTVPSPSSSVDSRSLTWTSSESGGSRESTTDFEDMYDNNEDVEVDKASLPKVIVHRPRSRSDSESASRQSSGSIESKHKLPSLIIPPTNPRGSAEDLKKRTLVPPTPPPKIPISPAILSLLAQNAPNASAPPSLDGSLTSDQVAGAESPSTPSSETIDQNSATWDDVLQLNPEALATLQSLSNNGIDTTSELVIEVSQATNGREMQQTTTIECEDNVELLTPCSNNSLSELTKLDIPSPGGFFSSLTAGARYNWCPTLMPPSSTTAEQFYQCPWKVPPNEATQRVTEVDPAISEEPSIHQQLTIEGEEEPNGDDIVENEVVIEYDEDYQTNLKETSSAHLDRTSMWLLAQETYLAKLRDTIRPDTSSEITTTEVQVKLGSPRSSPGSAGKKSVTFSDDVIAKDEANQKEPVFWKGCQYLLMSSTAKDALVHGAPRYDALQTSRICSVIVHRNQLLGKYQSMNKLLTDDPEVIPTLEQKQIAKAEKERLALGQIAPAAWNVMAIKTLNGGQLISAPAAARIRRRSRPTRSGINQRARILDLGGPGVCDWAWYCAEEYPDSKVYTVVAKATRQPSQQVLRGPHNHRQIAVQALWRSPFPSNYFDVISARSLHMLLKIDKPSGEGDDEYDLCLRECLRCLKPGGYLEYSLLDSDIIGAGPLGSAKSVEFGFSLKTMGYDPTPTRAWLGRLRKSGFVGVKRSWMFLPMGNRNAASMQTANREARENGAIDVEKPETDIGETIMGSTNDVASVTGLVGSLAWEKWMLKLQMESGKPDENLLEGVSSVIQEGRNCGAGWRSLSGWARKPSRK
ncbi:MAG: hypothetical protein M1837_002554 [Sclerophora amabilis]|nr:MAG: hypothetical protein M1837_002554 [Sclerophora amabilis]